MAITVSLNSRCKKITRRGGDIYIISKIEKPFYEEVYASVQESGGGKFVVDTINKGKGHYLGFSHKTMEPGRYSKSVALKKAIKWMKGQGEC